MIAKLVQKYLGTSDKNIANQITEMLYWAPWFAKEMSNFSKLKFELLPIPGPNDNFPLINTSTINNFSVQYKEEQVLARTIGENQKLMADLSNPYTQLESAKNFSVALKEMAAAMDQELVRLSKQHTQTYTSKSKLNKL